MAAVNATLWGASSAEGSSDDNNDHYTNSSCTLSGGSSTTINANCSFTLEYYANDEEWTCKLYANDSADATGTASIATVTVSSLVALDAENTISFGSLNPAATSAADVNDTVTNCGNVLIDINLSGTDLTNATATVANITVGQVKYNVTTYDQDYTANMTALTTSAVTRSEFDLAERTDDASASTKKSYWKIQIPSAPIEALTYSGTITFTALSG